MSQVGNTLKMYFLLQTKGKMKSREIANLLETDERTVRRYKGNLEQAGVFIESEKGKHGGYKLLNDNFLLGLNLTENEYLSLLLAEKHLNDTKHITSKDITLITEKVNVLNRNRNLPINEIHNHISKAILSSTNRESERKGSSYKIRIEALKRLYLEMWHIIVEGTGDFGMDEGFDYRNSKDANSVLRIYDENGKVLYQSDMLKMGMQLSHFDIDVKNVSKVKLEVDSVYTDVSGSIYPGIKNLTVTTTNY